jgi:hypothetical protein
MMTWQHCSEGECTVPFFAHYQQLPNPEKHKGSWVQHMMTIYVGSTMITDKLSMWKM